MTGTAAVPEVAFEEFYTRHRRHILAYCRRRASEHDARDATDETFLIAWRRWDEIPSGPAGDRARPWLYGVAYRVLSNTWRGNRRRRKLEDRLGQVRGYGPPGPSRELLASEDQRTVVAALERLEPGDQEVLRMAAWEELSYADIGVALDLSEDAVAQRVRRARKRLARELARADGIPQRAAERSSHDG